VQFQPIAGAVCLDGCRREAGSVRNAGLPLHDSYSRRAAHGARRLNVKLQIAQGGAEGRLRIARNDGGGVWLRLVEAVSRHQPFLGEQLARLFRPVQRECRLFQ